MAQWIVSPNMNPLYVLPFKCMVGSWSKNHFHFLFYKRSVWQLSLLCENMCQLWENKHIPENICPTIHFASIFLLQLVDLESTNFLLLNVLHQTGWVAVRVWLDGKKTFLCCSFCLICIWSTVMQRHRPHLQDHGRFKRDVKRWALAIMLVSEARVHQWDPHDMPHKHTHTTADAHSTFWHVSSYFPWNKASICVFNFEIKLQLTQLFLFEKYWKNDWSSIYFCI